jgi:hypothetical protein
MSTPWKKALVLGLVASLVASPALAGGRHKGRGHRGHRGDHAYAPRTDRHHHHGHGDADDVALALGLTAVGLTAFALWAAAQPPAPPVYGTPLDAPYPEPSDWSELDPGVTVLSEGYLDSGEFCREFQREIEIDGRIERGWGIACLMEDGSWRIGR